MNYLEQVSAGEEAAKKVVLWTLMIIDNCLSFRLSDQISVKGFFKECGIAALPGGDTLRNKVIPALYFYAQEKEIEIFKGDNASVTSVSITSDIWTSVNSHSFLSITYHYIVDWKLVSRCLDVIPLKEYRHLASTLANMIKDRMVETLGEKVILSSVVTDCASVMKVMSSLIYS